MPEPAVLPTRARWIAAGLAVVVFVVATWWWIDRRSAPPPPPPFVLPTP